MKLNKKILSLILSLTLGVTVLTGCSNNSSSSKNETKKIGITQLVEHPALDQTKKGFIEGLEENGFKEGENIEIDFQNAQNDNPTSQTIASNFANDKKDLIFAISTPSAQAALNATKDIPIVFTAVTDPVEAGLVKSNESSENNVTGTSDAIPVEKSLELIKKFVPNVKTIGVVCNTSEINSKLQIDRLKKVAKKEGINVVDKGVTQANEVNQAVASIVKESDVIFTPTDNLVASSMPIITKIATENKIPVIGSEKGHVENGALACNGISYKELGKKAGEMAAKILKGESKPSELSVVTLDDTETIINKNVMDELGIKNPVL
ncbi:ABC transporter substrate-binding protein [Peptacetobacter sp.]|uniref:ABC transporter substrate-binding protein n=1 Tax=Peptacetobacter sp. TaxID=2991975 RepID=UPI00260C12ED|nr:ABC transporter substrate-binding protein [Peptacetobacter sp.]